MAMNRHAKKAQIMYAKPRCSLSILFWRFREIVLPRVRTSNEFARFIGVVAVAGVAGVSTVNGYLQGVCGSANKFLLESSPRLVFTDSSWELT